MVVQEEDDVPIEAPISKQRQKYVVVKNHVRELLPAIEESPFVSGDTNGGERSMAKRKILKTKKELQQTLSSELEPTDITKSDLEELKTVYKKCKQVLKKIELKYGQLINLSDEKSISRNTSDESESATDECSCLRNKKIIFDENGQQSEKECQLGIHICPKRMKRHHIDSQPQTSAVQVEYDSISPNLPNSLQELESILMNTNINNVYRQLVINKIYLIRQENLNQIRYEKESIVKTLKENPDELLDFKGTNISSLSGYPMKVIEKNENSEKLQSLVS